MDVKSAGRNCGVLVLMFLGKSNTQSMNRSCMILIARNPVVIWSRGYVRFGFLFSTSLFVLRFCVMCGVVHANDSRDFFFLRMTGTNVYQVQKRKRWKITDHKIGA